MNDTLYGTYQAEMVHRHADEHDARNINPVHYAPVATLIVAAIAIQFVTLQHAWTFVGLAAAVPMVRVGVVADEHGIHVVV